MIWKGAVHAASKVLLELHDSYPPKGILICKGNESATLPSFDRHLRANRYTRPFVPDPHLGSRMCPACSETSDFRQVRKFIPYNTRQNMLAGTKPSCSVLNPMMQIMTLLIPARTHPSQHRRPTRMVEIMVNTHET